MSGLPESSELIKNPETHAEEIQIAFPTKPSTHSQASGGVKYEKVVSNQPEKKLQTSSSNRKTDSEMKMACCSCLWCCAECINDCSLVIWAACCCCLMQGE
ncbi:hypothetical protein Btru_058848 [Bulinus truncatus]|nr:hypothetical protein Btru_058848 [Bulinus truncatus]